MAHPAHHEHLQHTGHDGWQHHDHEGHDHADHRGHGHHEGGVGHGAHGTHEGHGAHAHHAGHGAGGAGWRTAAQATLHCLTGCAVGEVLGMVIGTALGLHGVATVVLAVSLAFVFGYAFTMRGVLRAGLDLRSAVKVALAADTVSILVMEIIDNTAMVTIPGAMDAGLDSVLFWVSLAGALALAFVLTVPINKWMIGRGRGHAVVHAYH